MALQKTGVQLVAENESGFVGALGRAQKAVGGFEGQVAKSAGGFGIAQAAAAGFAGFLGSAVLGAIGSAVTGFANLGKSAFSVVADYERLSMSLSALTAKEVLNAGAASNMADAMRLAAPLARELLTWVEELAIQSPFDQEGVAAALRTAVAYGFLTTSASSVADAQAKGIVTAQRLTQALIDWASAAGLSSFAMERVSLALGQMQAKGTVSGQELRQLTEAGFGANAVLAEMGYTLKDVENGLVSAEDFIKAFTESVERDFGGAAQRASGTLAGLANSLGDLGKRYLREFFGPIDQATGKIGGLLGVVQPILQKFVDTLMDERVLNAVRMLGLLLGDVLTGGISKAGEAMASFANLVGKPIIDTANNAFAWGQNIITQLASGIINAASSILINAINFVAQILANWFAPGSPPKIAPDLPQWGKGAINEWLKGFTEADYGVLKGIQGPLQSALNVLVSAGDMDKDAAGQTFANISKGLIEAMSSGTGIEEVLQEITESAGQFGPEIADLALKQFQLAEGVKAVEQAEKDLTAARKREEEAGVKVNQLTQEYNDLLRGGASGEVLKDKLAEINLAKDEQEAAKASANEAETRLDAAKETLAILEEQVKLQKELLDQLIAIAQAEIPTPVPEEPPPAGGTGGTPGGGGLPGFDPGSIEEKFNEMLDNIVESIKEKFANAFQPVVDAWNQAVEAIREAWNNFIEALTASGLIEQFTSIWTNLKELAVIGIGILREFIGRGLQTIVNIWNEHKHRVEQIWQLFWDIVARVAGDILGLIVSNIDERLEEARQFFEDHRQQVSNIISLFWGNVQEIVSFGIGKVLEFIQARLENIKQAWEENRLKILNSVNSLWDSLAEIFWSALGGLLETVETNLESLRQFWEDHKGSVEIIVDAFSTAIGEKFDNFINTTLENIGEFLEEIANFWEEHKDTVMDIIDIFFKGIQDLFQASLDTIGGILDTAAGLISGDWELFADGLELTWSGLWDMVEAVTNTGKEILTRIIEELKKWWDKIWSDIRQSVTDIWDGIVTKVTERVGAVRDTIKTGVEEALQAVTDKASEFVQAGKDLLEGMIDGIVSTASKIKEAILQAVNAAIEAALKALGIDSPSKVFMEIGTNVDKGFAEGIEKESARPAQALNETINGLVSPLAAASASYTTYNNTLSMSMPMNVSNQMDVNALKNLIIQTVKGAFQR